MNKVESKYFHTAERMDKAFLDLLETKDFDYITVKEICEKAGVNRSTFYLHYETIGDLLDESIAYMNRQFDSYFFGKGSIDIKNIHTASLDTLYLITPEYLFPFLQYVKDHQRVFRTAIEKSDVLRSDKKLEKLFSYVVSPIMDRYHVAEEKKPFLLAFYIDGIMGIVKIWLSHNCQEPLDFILDMMLESIKTPPAWQNAGEPG